MRIGVDLGGTKIEVVVIDDAGTELLRHRIPTPRGTYEGILDGLCGIVREAESRLASLGHAGPHTVGAGIPGAISPRTGLAMNANSTEINGRPLKQDLETALQREIRLANDANCLAVSEAVDGAAAGAKVVFAAILGTGCGAGVALDGAAWEGPHRIGGEWGHNPLPWPSPEELAMAETCWCGKPGCLETWISGTGFQNDFHRLTGRSLKGREIIAAMEAGDTEAAASFDRYVSRLGRALAAMANILDPEVIVLGGGMSRIPQIYERLPAEIGRWVFSDHFRTPIRPALHGDSSGVRGAAWLWGR
ncbi:ROK family protein [Rhabdaerophilum sp.]|uniref:ROK family protein n=1 Tax=Rhabdaerophilum sp. TaxID=2717341 RepID=UPI0038D41F07